MGYICTRAIAYDKEAVYLRGSSMLGTSGLKKDYKIVSFTH